MDVIYIDSLFGLNLLIDYCLVLASARVCGVVLRRWRYALAALIGAPRSAQSSRVIACLGQRTTASSTLARSSSGGDSSST